MSYKLVSIILAPETSFSYQCLEAALANTQDVDYIANFASPPDAICLIGKIAPSIVVLHEFMTYMTAKQFIDSMQAMHNHFHYIIIARKAQNNNPYSGGSYQIVIENTQLQSQLEKAIMNMTKGLKTIPLEIQAPEAPELDRLLVDNNRYLTDVVNQNRKIDTDAWKQYPFLQSGGWLILGCQTNNNRVLSFYYNNELISSIQNAASRVMKEHETVVVFPVSDTKLGIVINSTIRSVMAMRMSISAVCKAINGLIAYMGHHQLCFFTADTMTNSSNFVEQTGTLRRMCNYVYFIDENDILPIYKIKEAQSKSEIVEHGKELVSQLFNAVSTHNQSAVSTLLSEIMQGLKRSLSFQYLRYVNDQLSFIVNLNRRFPVELDDDVDKESNYRVIHSHIRKTAAYWEKIFEEMLSEQSSHSQYKNPYINSAIEYIRTHIDETVSLGEVADSLHISPSYLSHLFSSITGYSFSKMNNIMRCEAAKKLLITEFSIAEVANRMGYNNAKYFSRLFKSICGTSPKEYQNNVFRSFMEDRSEANESCDHNEHV